MGDGPPSKRARRTDSAAMWDSADTEKPRAREERRKDRDRDQERDKGRERRRVEERNGDRHRDRRRDREGDARRDRGDERKPLRRDERPRSRSPAADQHKHEKGAASHRREDHVNKPRRKKEDSDDEEMKGVLTTKPKLAKDRHKLSATGQDSDEEEALMRHMMGFAGFRSTKQTKVPGNNWYGVRKEKKSEYRQYMNRVGGFNRPLSPSR